MTNRTLNIDDNLYNYILASSLRESELLKALRKETEDVELSVMQIAPEQGQFMSLLVKLIGARRAIEIGTYTGYSSICIASALPDDGELIACDISKEWTDIAQRYWSQADLVDKINLHLAPAMETLDNLLVDGQQESFDFIFIDADKTHYDDYYECALKLIRRGGLIVIDNVLWSGAVANDSDTSEDTKAIRALNEKLKNDERIALSLLPVADGISLAVKN